MVFRWIYSVTLSFFTVQGGLILQPTQSDDGVQPASANSEWIEQVDVIRHRCIEEECRSEEAMGPSKSGCLATCLHNRLQSSPIIRKAKKTSSLIDVMTSTDPRDSEAFRSCLRHRCPLLDYRPQFFSRCVLERCIGWDGHLPPGSAPPSSKSQYNGMKESGSVEQVSSGDRNEERRRESTKGDDSKDRGGKQVYNGGPYLRLASSQLKRGYSDATDICIAFHCSSKPRGTWGFLKCVNDNRCAGR